MLPQLRISDRAMLMHCWDKIHCVVDVFVFELLASFGRSSIVALMVNSSGIPAAFLTAAPLLVLSEKETA